MKVGITPPQKNQGSLLHGSIFYPLLMMHLPYQRQQENISTPTSCTEPQALQAVHPTRAALL
jgi:hypothetical protein